MNRVLSILLVASTVVTPLSAIAQTSTDPVTRSEVRAQVSAAQQNGTLHQSKVHYPSEPVPTQTAANVDATSYGMSMSGSSESRDAVTTHPQDTLFLHH
jgi:hypothetical protein